MTNRTHEDRIMRATIKALIEAHKSISVYDGEEVTLRHSRDAAAIFAALKTTDDDKLFVYDSDAPGAKRIGWIWFVYGNDGADVICDYTVNLEDILAPVNALAERLLGA